MGIWLAAFLVISVNQAGASLRESCDAGSQVVTFLGSGASLKLIYSVSGQAVPCYKVSAEINGKTVSGYLSATSMDGLDSFDKGRKEAAWIEVRPTSTASETSSSKTRALERPSGGLRIQASKIAFTAKDLIENGNPKEALRLLTPEIRKHADASLLTLAGVAAWKDEDNRQALEYWKQSLELQPDPNLQVLYAKVEREVNNDVSKEKLYGMRVLLRYDDVTVPAETARQMTSAVDQAYMAVSTELGCRTEDRIVTIVQSWDAYQKTTQAAEWSGGLFDGRIHMPAVTNQQMTAEMQRRLTHETTHACLTMLGKWPTWLHEGMAQRLSGETLSPKVKERLLTIAREAKLGSLAKLNAGWGSMDGRSAAVAYGLALVAVDELYSDFGLDGVRNLLRNPERMASTIAELDRRLGL